MKRTIITILSAFGLLTCATLYGQTEKAAKTASLPTLLVGNRVAGFASEAYAMDVNAAGMSLSEGRLDAAAGFGMWQGSDNYLSAGVVFRPSHKFAVGLSFKDRMQKPYQITTGSGSDSRDGEFTPAEYSAALGAAYSFLPFLSAGISLKMVSSALAPEYKGSAFGADIALAYSQKGISAGLSVNNVGSKIKYGENAYSLPMLLKLNGAYSCEVAGNSKIDADIEADVVFAGGFMAEAGVEYGFKDMVFACAGYHYGGGSALVIPSYARLGLGVKFFGVSLDAAYITASETLGNSLSLSVGYSF